MATKKSKSAPKSGSKKKKKSSTRSGAGKGAPTDRGVAPAPRAAAPAADGGIPPIYIGVGLAGVAIIAYVLYTQYAARPANEPSSEVTASEGESAGGEGTSLEAPADVASPPADAERTSSGLASKVLRAGTGTAHPGPTTRVRVHYTGWTTDGERFDSSRERGEPIDFALNGVIAGWTEGVQLMVEGERRRFWIPEDLAYGGRPGSPAGMLVFDVELIDIL